MKFTLSLFALSTAVLLASAAQQQQQQQQQKPRGSAVCSQDLTGTGQADLDAIKGCKQFKGTITVANAASGELVLQGVETVTGSVIITDSSALTRLSAPSLKSVSGELRITQHTGLTKLELPALTEVERLALRVLPELEAIDFPAGLAKVTELTIDDTPAATVSGLTFDTIGKLTLSGNTRMKRFQLPASSVSSSLLVVGNNHELSFEAPQLVSLQAAEFREVGSISMPAVKRVEGDLSFHDNAFASLSLESLERVGGTMVVANNNHLAETSFSKLEVVGGALSVANNTQLSAVKGYPSLSTVQGAVDLAGRFDTYELPALQDVRGGMRIQTSSESFSCLDAEKTLKYGSVVKGTVWGCKTSLDPANMDPTVGQNDSTPSQMMPTKNQKAGGNGGNEGVADKNSSPESMSSSSSPALARHPASLVVAVGALGSLLFL